MFTCWYIYIFLYELTIWLDWYRWIDDIISSDIYKTSRLQDIQSTWMPMVVILINERICCEDVWFPCHVDFQSEALQAYVAVPRRAGGVSSSHQGRIGGGEKNGHTSMVRYPSLRNLGRILREWWDIHDDCVHGSSKHFTIQSWKKPQNSRRRPRRSFSNDLSGWALSYNFDWTSSRILGFKWLKMRKCILFYTYWVHGNDVGVNPKIGVFSPQIMNVNRGFHYFHHPFWGF